MSGVIFLAVICAVIAATAVLGSRRRRQEALELRIELEKSFGRKSSEPLTEEKRQALCSLPGGDETGRTGLDEITWNDLDLDQIYAGMNSCRTGSGELYLFRLLHQPASAWTAPALPEELLSFWTAHGREQLRTEVLAALSGTGDRGKYECARFRDILSGPAELSFPMELASLLLPAAALAVMFLDTRIGLLLLLAVLVWNIVRYFRVRAVIAGPLAAISGMLRLAEGCRKLPDLAGTPAGEDHAEIRRLSGELSSLGPGSRLLLREPGDPFRAAADYLCMLLHIDLLLFIPTLKQARDKAEQAERLGELLGKLDASIAVASWRESLPAWCAPDPDPGTEKAGLKIRGLVHPLLEAPVPNDLDTASPVLITGSNASGKSTFLKACALAAVLGQTVGTVPAEQYSAPCMRIYTSMALRDSLRDGQSYFIVEILSLKRILDASGQPGPILCCIDEVLRGTGTVERIAASAEILMELADRGVLCMAATHDGELCGLLSDRYTNLHFSEELSEGDVRFSYKLQQGPSRSRNAIRLLKELAYDSELVERAERRAETFLKEGTWEK